MARPDASNTAFGRAVENAATSPFVWNLIVFNPPSNCAALLNRFGFQRTKKDERNWFRLFDPDTDRAKAEEVREHLLAAGMKGRWYQVKRQPKRPLRRHAPTLNFAKPNVNPGWRMKQRRK